jgi:hypothetical protein
MTVEDITLLAGVYLVGAIVISLLAAFGLELRLKARLPANWPYMWGFFFGCICIAYVPLAALSALEMVRAALRAKWAAYEVHAIYTLVFALNVVCGWFILRRKGWAWILGTFFSPICAFPVLRDLLGPDLAHLGFLGYIIWLVNYVYGRKRWAEFHKQASEPPSADNKPFEPLRLLTSLEAKARPQEVLTLYGQGTIQPSEHSPAVRIPEFVSTQAELDAVQGQLALVFGTQGMRSKTANDTYRSSEVIHGLQGQRSETVAAANGE